MKKQAEAAAQGEEGKVSYCRWSTDCYQSDVYVYASNDGWVTHVASRRRVPIRPTPTAPPYNASVEEIVAYSRACDDWVRDESAWRWQDIDDPSAGESYCDPTAEVCAMRLAVLRANGIRVPDGVIEALVNDNE